MILIISIEQDESTIDIIKWLHQQHKEFILINNTQFIEHVTIEIDTGIVYLEYQDIKINFNKISSVWYRRGNFMFEEVLEATNPITEKINSFILKEQKNVVEYLHFLLNEKFCLNNYNHKKVNKLVVLHLAQNLGLQIPKTLITNSCKTLHNFLNEQNSITKPINNPINYYGDSYWWPTYTSLVDSKISDALPAKFGVSLFQKNIAKKLEIRSYFLVDTFYSMAIFSQEDQKTKVDFRQYNHEKPNRTVPFQLPDFIEGKLKTLALQLHLNSCSFDLIYTPNDEYIFLEVNPIGQFGMVSYPCNYYLEQKIAEKLI